MVTTQHLESINGKGDNVTYVDLSFSHQRHFYSYADFLFRYLIHYLDITVKKI